MSLKATVELKSRSTAWCTPGYLCCALLLGIALCLYATTAQSDGEEVNAAQLLNKIDAAQKRIETSQLAQSRLERQLRDNEQQRLKLESRHQSARARLAQSETRLTKLQQEYARQQQRAVSRRDHLTGLIRVHYTRNNYSPLRIILESQLERNWNRQLTYLRHLTAAQWELAVKTEQLSNQLGQLVTQQATERSSIARQTGQIQQQLTRLRLIRQERATTLDKLRASLGEERDSLNAYQAQRQRLTGLAGDLGELRADELALDIPFVSLRGKLMRPLPGNFARHDHLPGLVFSASYGDQVRSVGAGRVVFTNWIRGLGLVIILDHGMDYLSLYAHNQSLAVQLGEWVESGEVISYAGDSGGQHSAGLYFQLLHSARALDAASWLAKDTRPG